MSLNSQLRVSFMFALLPLLQIACASVPQVESRLKGFQLSQNTYVARPGDTLETIAFRYRLDEQELSAMNPQLSGDIVTGQSIIVHQFSDTPASLQTASASTVQSRSSASTPNLASPTRTTITSAVTQPTLIYDAPEAEVSFEQIREIPANAVTPVNNPRAVRLPIEEVVPDELDAQLGYTSLPIASQVQINTPATQNIIAAPRGNATNGWVWPTWGEIAREFSPTETGGHGIDIAGIPGQEIHAASGGTVAYAGRDLSGGDGKLIIIRHHSGLMTTYSHARQLFVAEDDVVRAGDVIASLGANARNESVLRFEVRQDGNPLNPMNFLTN